jgi:signal transduction histidine kinase
MWLDGLSLAYRNPFVFRLPPMTEETRSSFNERQAERMRIARDLHDTVLQGVLSASMQLDVAADQLPANSPVKPRLIRVLELMGRAIEEARHAVQGLRSPTTEFHDLAEVFARIPQEVGAEERINFRVLVLGSARQLHPVIRDEIYRIGREALVNAFRHSRASCIEVALEYGARRFRLIVRDNGCGIDPHVLHAGRDGHWGLPGMRERAEKLGAKLRVWSRTSAGTEIELSVSNGIAIINAVIGHVKLS